MNAITSEIVAELLKDASFWDHGTKKKPIIPAKFLYGKFINRLKESREYLYNQRVMFPKYFLMVRLMRSSFPDGCFSWDEDSQNWMIDDYELQLLASEKLENYLDWFLINHPEWDEEIPTEAEILAMNTVVQPMNTVVQLSLF